MQTGRTVGQQCHLLFHVQTSITVDGGISIHPAKWDRKAFAKELKKSREAMPMGGSVIEELRLGARY